eukprot:862960-Prymnesium_polylepis.1
MRAASLCAHTQPRMGVDMAGHHIAITLIPVEQWGGERPHGSRTCLAPADTQKARTGAPEEVDQTMDLQAQTRPRMRSSAARV